MQYTHKWLIERANSGVPLTYLFFWGHQPSKDGSITSTCFSQWWEGHPFESDGILYQTAEHYMMAGKARLFNDVEMLKSILAASSPGEAKKLGRKVRGFDHKIWEEKRCDIVTQGNYLKFSQHPDLREYLQFTDSRIIVEASPVDKIWGIGMDRNNEAARYPERWRGKNLLGFCLMEVRDILRVESEF